MAPELAKLLNDALKLPEMERAELAGRLLESLDPVEDEAWAQSWERQVLDRIEELESKHIAPIAWAEARDLILRDSDGCAQT